LGASFADNAPAYRVGKSDLLVIEADESDESYSKYECEGFILTNLAEDHLDRYGSLNGIIQSFKNYCESTKIRRWLVYNADNEAASNVASVYSGKRISFGQTGIPSFQLRSHSQGDFISTFSWSENLKNHDSSLPMPGIHNIENALAALAAASALGVDVDRAAHALTRFPGMDKRLKRHFDNGQCIVFEDYAHNPGKIDACLRGLKEAYPGHKIVCVFQPHRFSRLHTTYDLFLRSFTSADHVYVLPVYSAGETSAEAHEISELTKNISHFSKIRATVAEDLQRAVTQLEYLLNEKAVVVTVGAGDVGYVASELARRWS
jgi:UDP-N-acetylmuramate--alanine ligase